MEDSLVTPLIAGMHTILFAEELLHKRVFQPWQLALRDTSQRLFRSFSKDDPGERMIEGIGAPREWGAVQFRGEGCGIFARAMGGELGDPGVVHGLRLCDTGGCELCIGAPG